MKIKVTVLYVQEMEIEMTKGRLCTWVGKCVHMYRARNGQGNV